MKNRLLLFLALITAIVIGLLWLNTGTVNNHRLLLQFTSDPFPLNVGPTTLYFTLENEGGTDIDGATLGVSSYIQTGGQMTLSSPVVQNTNGLFAVPVTYPRTGQWTLDVTVNLPDSQKTIQERYLVYVYGVSPRSGDGVSLYRSVSESESLLAANPAKERWIIIPQGAQEITIHTFTDNELIPSEIYLQASGQNILIIQNDDVVDHTVGPFFIRAGETIRQQFLQPAVFQGACSIRHSGEVSIIVEA